jgi:hypothetical protein
MTKLFFSWQSDVAQNATTRAIRKAVAAAASAATAESGQLVQPEGATRDVAGSPYVPFKLAEKIRGSDIFIADITTVALTATGKSVPNPNVAYELGLAAAHLGWDRIVLLFNEEVATFKDLPFDFDRHRISLFKVAEADKVDAAQQKSLSGLVTLAVRTIIDKNPPRPRDLEGKSDAEIKQARDVANLSWFFRHLSVDMLGIHVREMPDRLHYFAPVMYDGLDAVVSSPSFRLYDGPLEERLRSLVESLGRSLRFGHLYRELNSSRVQAFGMRGPHRDFENEQEAAQEISKIVATLAADLESAVETVRNGYLEIDLDETSLEFAKEYAEIVKPD